MVHHIFEDFKISIDDNFEISKNMEIEWKSIHSIKLFISKLWFSENDFCKLKEDEIFQLYWKQRWIILNNNHEDFAKIEKYFQ